MTEGARPPAPDAPLEPDPMLGRTLADRYRVLSLVARGGMARVYRAHDERLDREVAVKVLAPPYSDDVEFTRRFLGEARAAASLSHPSLVHVYDSGSDAAAHYIVMELLDRHRTLRDVLAERGTLPVAEVVRIGRELLAGLRVVHERELVHCDVKAANVMLGPGPAKLIDFGIARPPDLREHGETSIGTLGSMSPEQLRGEPLTPASDLFSLGVVLYAALTGRMPYPGSTPDEVAAAHREARVTPPSELVDAVPDRLDAVILQSLRPAPESRFRSATAMDRALGTVVAGGAVGDLDDETRVVPAAGRSAGYVPPPVPNRAPPPAPAPRARSSAGVPPRAPASRRRRMPGWGAIGPLLILAAAGLVVLFVVVPLLELGSTTGGPGDGDGATPTVPAASATPTLGRVPPTVGLSAADGIAAAEAAGLDWTIRCNHDETRPEGIVDQEPPEGTEVTPGSRFTMYSARIDDCRGGDDDEGGNGNGNGNGNGRGNGNGGDGD